MFVFSAKKIKNILLGIFAIFLILTIMISSENKDYVSTVGLPVSGKTIVIDAGHGKPDERSRSGRWYNRSRN